MTAGSPTTRGPSPAIATFGNRPTPTIATRITYKPRCALPALIRSLPVQQPTLLPGGMVEVSPRVGSAMSHLSDIERGADPFVDSPRIPSPSPGARQLCASACRSDHAASRIDQGPSGGTRPGHRPAGEPSMYDLRALPLHRGFAYARRCRLLRQRR